MDEIKNLIDLYRNSFSRRIFTGEIETKIIEKQIYSILDSYDDSYFGNPKFLLISDESMLNKIHMSYPHGWFSESKLILLVIGNNLLEDEYIKTGIAVGKFIERLELLLTHQNISFATICNFDESILKKEFGLGIEEKPLFLMAFGRSKIIERDQIKTSHKVLSL